MPQDYFCGRCEDSDQQERLGKVETRMVFSRCFGNAQQESCLELQRRKT